MKINQDSIKSNVRELVNKCISDDITTIGILRFGAHIPHIYANSCVEVGEQARSINLLLSHMLSFFPLDFFKDKKFLLLDDTVYQGDGIRELKTQLINKFGVDEKNIKAATLIVHEDSRYKPDFYCEQLRLRNTEYIAWKEILGSIVASDIRPTERDHPLYFFKVNNIGVGRFLEFLENFGKIHSVGNWNGKVLKFSLTIDSLILNKISELDGLDIGEIYKVRFYWKQRLDSGESEFTAVPMGFPIIDLEKFISNGSSRILANLLGLEPNFFENLKANQPEYRNQMLFYYISRGISAWILELLLEQINPLLQTVGSEIEIIDPNIVDGSVHYIFPNSYEYFYNTIFNEIDSIIKTKRTPQKKIEHWKKPVDTGNYPQIDRLIPSIFTLLKIIVEFSDSAYWDGKNWRQRNIERGVPFRNLLSEVKNPIYISKALDELLESGLLRAKDMSLKNLTNCYTRVFLPGGEYNAVAVSRINDTLTYEPNFKVSDDIIKEEAIELWGPF